MTDRLKTDWFRQRTIRGPARLSGRGYLSGVEVDLEFRPAPPDSGIVFERTDLPGRPTVAATIDHVVPRQRRTAIAQGEAVVEMVEHVMAALAGLGIDNCVVASSAAETPGCDGSSLAFVETLRRAGVLVQDAPAKILHIERPVTIAEGGMSIAVIPHDEPAFRLAYELDYPNAPAIGRQSFEFALGEGAFEAELASARTFVLDHEAEMLRAAGIGRHCTSRDLLIFGPNGPIGNVLRFPDEPVRHKMLDVLGDLALVGHRIHGKVIACKSGHALNAALARRIVEDVRRSVDDDLHPGLARIA
jgi:UDP-3-O-acyl N-acetylglucosamine deacetylase